MRCRGSPGRGNDRARGHDRGPAHAHARHDGGVRRPSLSFRGQRCTNAALQQESSRPKGTIFRYEEQMRLILSKKVPQREVRSQLTYGNAKAARLARQV